MTVSYPRCEMFIPATGHRRPGSHLGSAAFDRATGKGETWSEEDRRRPQEMRTEQGQPGPSPGMAIRDWTLSHGQTLTNQSG
jgi:hypothetical protein